MSWPDHNQGFSVTKATDLFDIQFQISWHRISSSNTRWKIKRMLLRIFFLLLFLFFSFLFFISLCRIMYTKNIIYFQWNNIPVIYMSIQIWITVLLTCIPQTETKPTLADILRIYYLPNKWHFEDFNFILLPNVACNLNFYRLEFLWVSDYRTD